MRIFLSSGDPSLLKALDATSSKVTAMSVDITPATGEPVDISNVGWSCTLDFAKRNGWLPSGTAEPADYDEEDPWDGCYDPAMGQMISNADAVALGEAIKRGLASDRRDELLRQGADSLTAEMRQAGYTAEPVQVTEKSIKWLHEFSDLAVRSGAFRID